jgi:hypothetical protein
MPNPTIDLQRDCELWCDFDTDYFDSQRNKILDRSGNGRNPEASGGPTLGANGPDNFEAASFDGSDDFFSLDTPLAISGSHSFFLLIGGNASEKVISNRPAESEGFRVQASTSSQKVTFSFFDSGGNVKEVDFNDYQSDSPAGIYGEFNSSESEIRLIVNNVNAGTTSAVGQTLGTRDFTIGATGSKIANLDGKISTVARWSRTLSDAEITYLNRLTKPRRAQL